MRGRCFMCGEPLMPPAPRPLAVNGDMYLKALDDRGLLITRAQWDDALRQYSQDVIRRVNAGELVLLDPAMRDEMLKGFREG